MRLCKLAFVALVVVCVTARGALAEGENIEGIKEVENLAIENGEQKRPIELPAMIDFARFKQLYDKHYPSALVAMNRAKLFAINAYSVFISRVKYVWRKSPSYLAINQYSDMTALERHRLLDIYLGPPESRKIRHEAAKGEADKRRKKREAEGDEFELEARPLTASDLLHEMPQLPEQVARSIADGSTDIEDMLHSSGGQVGAGNNSSSSGANHRSRRTRRVPDQVYLDLRTTGCIQPARQQGRCGSCYAMAATALYEYRFCGDSGTPIDFSIQYVIDCGPLFRQLNPNPDYFEDLNGCGGGREAAVGAFYSSFGFHLEDEYPYSGVDQECLVPFDRDEYKLGRIRVDNGKLRQHDLTRLNDDRIQRLMASKGPLSVVTQIDDSFPFYGGGVQEFTCDQVEFGHSLVLVGRGIEDNREYWIMRNSFGEEWGENGYWRVATDITSCFVLLHSLRDPQFTFNQNYVPL